MSNAWQFKVGDKIHGPYSDSQLEQLIRSGRIDPDSLVRPSDESNWRKAGTTPGLFGNLNPTDSTAVANSDEIIDEVLFGKSFTAKSDGDDSGSTKACPFCAETIQTAAVKCRHCGEFLDGRPRASVSHPKRPPMPMVNLPPSKGSQPSFGVAAVLSFFVCGLGQIYKGQVGLGFVLMFLDVILWSLVIAASPIFFVGSLLLHVLAIVDAAKGTT